MYQRSLPKEFGTEEERFYMVFTQRTPEPGDISEELLKIPLEPRLDSTAVNETDTTPDIQVVANQVQEAEEPITPTIEEAQSNPDTKYSESFTFEEQSVEHHDPEQVSVVSDTLVKTPPSPPTVIRRLSAAPDSNKVQFKDSLDFEVGDGLRLAETISAAVETMSEDAITAELVRNNTSTTGTTEEKRRRLQQKICMSLGELSVTTANSSLNFMTVDTPEDSNLSVVHDDLEATSHSQQLIENTLKHVVDLIVSINGEIKALKAETTAISFNSDQPNRTNSVSTNELKKT